jgi:uncharacterized protein (TIGR00730 family)
MSRPTAKRRRGSAGSSLPVVRKQRTVQPYIPRSVRRKHLDSRLQSLYQRAMLLEKALIELEDNRFYRTCIFGSARIKPDTEAYNEVFLLARLLSWEGIDVLTGGGPGLMDAANRGAQLGKQEKKTKTLSYGISIRGGFEREANTHIDVKRHHQKFSSRLDDFMRLSHSVVITPGGVGTLLELFFTWQLIQVKHIPARPIVFLDKKFWSGILSWLREVPLARGLIGPADFDCISIADSPEEVAKIISAHHREFLRRNGRRAGEE